MQEGGRATPIGDRSSFHAVGAAVLSRIAVMATAVATVSLSGESDPVRNAKYGSLIHPFSGLADTVFSALAKWDAVFYLGIAVDGYTPDRSPFYPFYPLLIRASGGFTSSRAALVSAHVVSLVAFGVSVFLLYRLATLELGPGVGRAAVVLLAFFPGSLFFSAPYTESVFLATSLGCFYAARLGRWPLAGIVGFVAALTRPTGIFIIVPLLLFYFLRPSSSAKRLRPDVLWLLLPVAGLATFALYLDRTVGDALAPYRGNVSPGGFGRQQTVPFGALIGGIREAGSAAFHLNFDGPQALFLSSYDVTLLAITLFAVVATVGVFRRLPVAYGAYVVVCLALPLSLPRPGQALISMPRYICVLFPIFIWLGTLLADRIRLAVAVAVSLPVLLLFTSEHSRWIFIA